MARIALQKPSLAKLLGIPWWVPAAIAAALYAAIQWGISAIPASNPLFGMLDGIVKSSGLLIAGLLGVFAGILYYKQRMRTTRPTRLLEPHFSIPSPALAPKGQRPDVVHHLLDESEIAAKSAVPTTKHPGWSIDLLRQLDQRLLEELVAACFREESFRSESKRIDADEGADIQLYEKGRREVYAVVQCLACHSRQVGVRPVRELLGTMTHDNVPRGIFVTTAGYAQETIDFAKAHPIVLVSGEMMINDILSYSDDARTRLMNALVEAGLEIKHTEQNEAADQNAASDPDLGDLGYVVDEPDPEELVPDPANEDADESSAEKESNSIDFPMPDLDPGTPAVSALPEAGLTSASTALEFPALDFPTIEPTIRPTQDKF